MKNLIKNKRGVFGLTAVQSFFAIILGIALLAYIIVVIMGVLSSNTIIPSISSTTTNESITAPTTAGVTLAGGSLLDGSCSSITSAINASGSKIGATNYTQTGCTVVNSSDVSKFGSTWKVNYPYTYSSDATGQSRLILGNVSSGVTSFFGAINPVYAILAVLVIILVLVVLVRVVQAPNREGASQQL